MGTFETEIREVLTAKFPIVAAEGPTAFSMETQRLYVPRLRAAYKLGLETDRRIKAEAGKPPESQDKDALDLERPLGPKSLEKLEKTWEELRHLKFIGL